MRQFQASTRGPRVTLFCVSGWGWQWIAPEGWPQPPEGWTPPPGWHPDPAWPAPPPGHIFWRRRSRSRLTLSLIVTACVGCTAILGTFFGAVGFLGSCAFDPPPGDVGSMTLTNDLTRVITFEECLEAQCSRRDGTNSSGPVAPGAGVDWNHELCTDEPVQVIDSNGHLLGCLVLPADDPAKVTHIYATAAAPCR